MNELEVPSFSLKRIVENLDQIPSNGKFGDEVKALSPTEKKRLMELVSKFNEYGKVLRCEHALMDTAKTLDEITRMAEAYAMTESSDYFQGRVVERDFKQVKGITKDFKKIAQECYGKIQQLNALYEDMGHVLGRYYEIKTLDELQQPNTMFQQESGMSVMDEVETHDDSELGNNERLPHE